MTKPLQAVPRQLPQPWWNRSRKEARHEALAMDATAAAIPLLAAGLALLALVLTVVLASLLFVLLGKDRAGAESVFLGADQEWLRLGRAAAEGHAPAADRPGGCRCVFAPMCGISGPKANTSWGRCLQAWWPCRPMPTAAAGSCCWCCWRAWRAAWRGGGGGGLVARSLPRQRNSGQPDAGVCGRAVSGLYGQRPAQRPRWLWLSAEQNVRGRSRGARRLPVRA